MPGVGEVPVQLIQALPYLLTVFLLAGFIGRAVAPKAAGVPLRKGALMDDLLHLARRMMLHAHAPYSKFHVGAAVRGEDGSIHGGCNVENAAYPQGLCAEAGAIAALVAAGASTSSNASSSGPAPR